MNPIGFRIYCISIAVLFFLQSAFSSALIKNGKVSEAIQQVSCAQKNVFEIEKSVMHRSKSRTPERENPWEWWVTGRTPDAFRLSSINNA